MAWKSWHIDGSILLQSSFAYVGIPIIHLWNSWGMNVAVIASRELKDFFPTRDTVTTILVYELQLVTSKLDVCLVPDSQLLPIPRENIIRRSLLNSKRL